MSGDLETRLSSAIEASRELEEATRRLGETRELIQQATEQVRIARNLHRENLEDVQRLERWIPNLIALAVLGPRERKLWQARDAAAASHNRLVAAECQLAMLKRECEVLEAREEALAGARQALAAALDQKEQQLISRQTSHALRLRNLADERRELAGRLELVERACRAAEGARQALTAARDEAARAAKWSIFDLLVGGGLSSVFKHSRLKAAAASAAEADKHLAELRDAIAYAQGFGPTASHLEIGGLTRFVDIWMSNAFTDFSVHGRINRARERLDHTLERVTELQRHLAGLADRDRARMSELEASRRYLLTWSAGAS